MPGPERASTARLSPQKARLLARLSFDTEADAVTIEAKSEDDLRAVARVIKRLASA